MGPITKVSVRELVVPSIVLNVKKKEHRKAKLVITAIIGNILFEDLDLRLGGGGLEWSSKETDGIL